MARCFSTGLKERSPSGCGGAQISSSSGEQHVLMASDVAMYLFALMFRWLNASDVDVLSNMCSWR